MNQASPFLALVKRELARNLDLYAPLRVLSAEFERQEEANSGRLIDGIAQLGWNDRKETFVVELKARSAPKTVQEGIRRLNEYSRNGKERLLIVPYLSQAVVELIQPEGISALDLNGNYFIQTKDLLAIRLDRPNQYRESQSIKQVFSGSSSILGRFLLIDNKTYTSVNEIFTGIRSFGGVGGNDPISLPTVSKVLKRLEEELIIEKSRNKIRILQSEKLLDRLRDEYRPPKITDELKLKLPDGLDPWKLRLTGIYAFTGESSAQRYVATTAPTLYSMYVADITYLLRTADLKKYEEARFPNLILRETLDAFVYFGDMKKTGAWASPIQCYLELSQLDKREREIAKELKKEILGPFE